jgi:myo-inositol-1(or 4)-monophosphatase
MIDLAGIDARITQGERLVGIAGAATLARLGTIREPMKKGEIDLVTEADLESQRLLVEGIATAFPGDAVYAEEGAGAPPPGKRLWVIDPLDGTTNFTHGLPIYAVSVAFVDDETVQFGWVFAPALGESYFARRGGGAFRNGLPISVSTRGELTDSLLVTGFPYDLRTNPCNNLDRFSRFMMRARAVRRLGSASLDMAYVAWGRFDGYWELSLSPWDLAAGSLLVTEAGGRVTDLAGGAYRWTNRDVVASNGIIHPAMMGVLAESE